MIDDIKIWTGSRVIKLRDISIRIGGIGRLPIRVRADIPIPIHVAVPDIENDRAEVELDRIVNSGAVSDGIAHGEAGNGTEVGSHEAGISGDRVVVDGARVEVSSRQEQSARGAQGERARR